MEVGIKSAVYLFWTTIERSLYPSLNMCDWDKLHEFIETGDATSQELADAVEDEVYPEWSATAVWVDAGLEVRSYNKRCTVLLRHNGTTKISFATPSVTHIGWVLELLPAIIRTAPLTQDEYWKDTTYVSLGGKNDKEQ